jgi:hypothetical protein
VIALVRRLAGSAPLWLPALLLVAVGANQLRLTRVENLSPWSGGGFGMFSTTDAPGNRHLHAFVQNEGIRREIAVTTDLQRQVRRATTLPTRTRLRALADELMLREYGSRVAWDEIEIQVWAVEYDLATLAPGGDLVRKENFAVATP